MPMGSYCGRMLIAGVVCLGVAVASGIFGVWSLVRKPSGDTNQLALRAMAPTQVAAAVMLTVGGVVALGASGHLALVVLIVCVAGALGTLATGSWQSARYALRQTAPSVTADCGGSCAGCTLSCK